MSEKITVIKARKRDDLWDYTNNKPIKDTTPIGFVMDVYGAVPESYIKWTPNKIFDKRKYPELFLLFGKDHLPTDLELKCFVMKNYDLWHSHKTAFSLWKFLFNLTFSLIVIIMLFVITLLYVR